MSGSRGFMSMGCADWPTPSNESVMTSKEWDNVRRQMMAPGIPSKDDPEVLVGGRSEWIRATNTQIKRDCQREADARVTAQLKAAGLLEAAPRVSARPTSALDALAREHQSRINAIVRLGYKQLGWGKPQEAAARAWRDAVEHFYDCCLRCKAAACATGDDPRHFVRSTGRGVERAYCIRLDAVLSDEAEAARGEAARLARQWAVTCNTEEATRAGVHAMWTPREPRKLLIRNPRIV